MTEERYSKLVASDEQKAAGSFVKTSQGTADKDGFSHVSQYWLPKTMTFDQGFEQLATCKQGKADIIHDVRDVNFIVGSDGKFTVGLCGKEYKPTDWAAKQLATWLGIPQTLWIYYNGRDHKDCQDLLARAYRIGRDEQHKEKKELLFRTYTDGTIRGVQSNSYSIVDNEWYLKVLQEYVPGARLSHFHFADGENFYGNVLIPDTIRSATDTDMGGMLKCGNSEIGKRRVFQKPAIFSAICMNGCVWGEGEGIGLEKRHRGLTLLELKEMIRLNIEKQIPLLTTKIPEFIATHKLVATAPITNIFVAIQKQHTLNNSVIQRVAETWLRDSNEKSAYGVIDAFTRAGQTFDADTWETCDTIGGRILNGGTKGWIDLNADAIRVKDEVIAKSFAS